MAALIDGDDTAFTAYWCASAVGGSAPRVRLIGGASGMNVNRRGTSLAAVDSPFITEDATARHNVAIVFTGTTVSGYLDDPDTGVFEASAQDTITLGTLDRFCIGGTKLGSDTVNQHGTLIMRRFALWPTALSEGDLATVFGAWSSL